MGSSKSTLLDPDSRFQSPDIQNNCILFSGFLHVPETRQYFQLTPRYYLHVDWERLSDTQVSFSYASSYTLYPCKLLVRWVIVLNFKACDLVDFQQNY